MTLFNLHKLVECNASCAVSSDVSGGGILLIIYDPKRALLPLAAGSTYLSCSTSELTTSYILHAPRTMLQCTLLQSMEGVLKEQVKFVVVVGGSLTQEEKTWLILHQQYHHRHHH